jgi:hypothetical protein
MMVLKTRMSCDLLASLPLPDQLGLFSVARLKDGK